MTQLYGTLPNQVPTNSDLGTMAFQDASAIKVVNAKVTGLLSPSSIIGIAGTTFADSVQAGSVGEVITASGTSVPLSSAAANLISISLTPGDWMVFGNGGCASSVEFQIGTSSVSATFPVNQCSSITTSAATAMALTAPTQRFNLSVTTTLYLVANAVTGSAGYGTLLAIRTR